MLLLYFIQRKQKPKRILSFPLLLRRLRAPVKLIHLDSLYGAKVCFILFYFANVAAVVGDVAHWCAVERAFAADTNYKNSWCRTQNVCSNASRRFVKQHYSVQNCFRINFIKSNTKSCKSTKISWTCRMAVFHGAHNSFCRFELFFVSFGFFVIHD